MRRLLAVVLAAIVLLATPAITSSLTTPDDPFYSREWALTAFCDRHPGHRHC